MQLLKQKLCVQTRAGVASPHDHTNTIVSGDCCVIMQQFPANSIDLILTDPPYLINYKPRDGRRVAGDDTDAWLLPAFTEAYRVLKPDRFCVSFYGTSTADKYLVAWRSAGFRTAGHIVWVKSYASGSK